MQSGGISYWWRDIGLPARRAALDCDCAVDICIIGAGYTGLWTALYVRAARPDLSILLLEAEFAGFGASGRNGGWLTGGFAWSHQRYARSHGEAAVRAMVSAMNGTVAEVIAQAKALSIEADILPTQELAVARSPAQWQRLAEEYRHRAAWGEADRLRLISAAQLGGRIAIPNALGALEVEGVARIHPAKLVRGLAQAVEARGIRIAEGTRVARIAAGRVETTQGIVVQARSILRCTEGFSAALPGQARSLLPLNSAQVITPVLPAEIWAKIGWEGAEILGDFAHSYCYCQRTADGRIAFGGRGIPYRFGSGLDYNGQPDARSIAQLKAGLARMFPAVAELGPDHAWCGTLGVPRDWCASVGYDAETGLGHAGGYVGVGVATSNLAGRSLADLVLGRDTPLSRLPWVNRPVRRWEPEPLRWMGVRGMYAAYAVADRAEAKGGPPSKLAAIANRLTGR